MARDARQERRDQEITNILTQAQSSTTDRSQSQNLPPTSGKVVVATLPNPQNAEYVGMALPTMYTVEGDIRTLDMSKVKNKFKNFPPVNTMRSITNPGRRIV